MHIWFLNRSLRAFVAWSTCLALALPSTAMAGDGPFRLIDWHPTGTPVEQLARQIDKLEKRIDQDGSIVIKTPDVWGESRLMRHRSDVETQLKARLGAFDFRINGVQATRDAAFLATAVALQEEISSRNVAALGPVPATVPNTPTPQAVNNAVAGLIGDPNILGTNTTPSFIPRTEFRTNTIPVTGGNARALSVNIEPVIELDQMNRYLQHLNELRRLNEGDDNSDTPGYALNLIRIPVSVLPGRRTEQGFGAEVQITIDPYMSDEILPMAFKDFVIKGLVDRIGFDVFQIAQRADIVRLDNDLNLEPKDDKEKFYKSLQNKPTYMLRAFSEELSKPENRNVFDAASKAGLVAEQLMPDEKLSLQKALEAATKPEAQARDEQVLQYRLLADVNHRDLAVAASHRGSVNGNSSEGLQRIALHAYDCLVSTGVSSFSISREVVEPDHRLDHGLTMPEVDTLLTREAEAAYRFLVQPSAENLWIEFCTHDLARLVREHRTNYAKDSEITPDSVELIRTTFLQRVHELFPGAHNTVTEALAWQIILESALVNERLITDMKETATLKNCPCVATDCMSFFGPNPPFEAHEAFRQYVKCKWPIHVFALDPVTQDQNISDSFSQRREMQMAMAIAASGRILGGQAMQRFVRRMEYDLETIQLNRTAVAFSHGDNTFGWRFYPRVQAPPVPGNLSAITHDLLIGGQNQNQLLNTRRLEPGIRECTALVVMPSFVPQVMVDVRTDWFRLAKHVPFYPFNKRKPDHEDSMELSKQLIDLRCLQTECMNDAHKYRDGDVYRLCKAVERLEERLPMQTHNVSVPWENDLGGFEVFQSGTQVLGPEIHGWYGAPGITVLNTQLQRNLLTNIARLQQAVYQDNLDLTIEKAKVTPNGEEVTWLDSKLTKDQGDLTAAGLALVEAEKLQTSTAVFLVGKNFSVLNCRVIAGGVDVTHTIEVINRNLMEVRIPSTVSTVSTNHTEGVDQKFVVVHLATPYGATSRLLVPVAEGDSAEKAAAAAKAAADVKTVADESAKAAVGAHEVNHHPIKYTLDAPEDASATIVFDASGQLLFRLDAPSMKKTAMILVQDGDTIHDLLNSKSVSGQLAFSLVVSSKNPEVASKKVNIGLWDFEIGKPLTLKDFEENIRTSLPNVLPPDFDAKEITLQAFVRFGNDSKVGANQADREVFKVQGPIKIRISQTVKCPCPPEKPASTPVPAVSRR